MHERRVGQLFIVLSYPSVSVTNYNAWLETVIGSILSNLRKHLSKVLLTPALTAFTRSTGTRNVLLRWRYSFLGTRFRHEYVFCTCHHHHSAQPTTRITGATQLNSSLLTLSVIAVLLPAAFHSAVQPSSGQPDPLTDAQEGHDILAISHGASSFFFAWLSQLTAIHLGCGYSTFQ